MAHMVACEPSDKEQSLTPDKLAIQLIVSGRLQAKVLLIASSYKPKSCSARFSTDVTLLKNSGSFSLMSSRLLCSCSSAFKDENKQ
ncbi:hypothetical protein V6N13_107086 [Hibiscus sabdariffa]|uniref:Uncharacterized protein n=1 Tax=Hibiscus sabdariffa TaxID=183260 RepID=A0ABR2F2U2_9ROSI